MNRVQRFAALLVATVLVFGACASGPTPVSVQGSASPCPGIVNAAGQCVSASVSPSPSPTACPGVVNASGQCVTASPSPSATACPGVVNASGQCVTASPSPSPSACPGVVDASGQCVTPTSPPASPTTCPGIINAAGQCVTATASPAPTATTCPGIINAAGQCVTATAPPSPSPSPSPSASTWPLSATVYIYNPMTPFGPQTVNIGVGGTVTFNNVNSGKPWSITFVSGPPFPTLALPTSPSITTTGSFTVPGNYEYVITGSPSFVVHGHIIVN